MTDSKPYVRPPEHLTWRPNHGQETLIREYGDWRYLEGKKLEDPYAGGRHHNTIGVAGELGVVMILGLLLTAREMATRDNWHLHDDGYDFEHRNVKHDVKAVDHDGNPTLMLRQDRPGKAERYVLALVDLDPMRVTLVGWIWRSDLFEAYEIRESFCNGPLKVPARCVPHFKLQSGQSLFKWAKG